MRLASTESAQTDRNAALPFFAEFGEQRKQEQDEVDDDEKIVEVQNQDEAFHEYFGQGEVKRAGRQPEGSVVVPEEG